jgi:chorismate synthase
MGNYLREVHQELATLGCCVECQQEEWPCATTRLLDDRDALEARNLWLVTVLQGVEWGIGTLCAYCRSARNDKALRNGHTPDCLIWDGLHGGTMHTPAEAVQP